MINRILCVASGPSLTKEDYLLAAGKSDIVISTNNAWFKDRPPNIVYGFDSSWWEVNYDNVPFSCSKYCHYRVEGRPDVKSFFHMNSCYNSGCQAIFLACTFAPREIVLIGYDCDITEGTHFHGDHGNGLRNPDQSSVNKWLADHNLAKTLIPEEIKVINCSRRTKIRCYETGSLESLKERPE